MLLKIEPAVPIPYPTPTDATREDSVRDAHDDGFTLVEALVAMMLLGILAVSTAGVITNTLGVSKSNAARVAAANLAAEEISRVRQLRAIDVPDGAVTVTPNRVVNGVEYTVTRSANYVLADSSASPCTGPATSSSVKLTYKLITVTVTWPGMGSVKPVRQDTLLTLGVGESLGGSSTGTGAIAVTGANGTPRSGVTVTLSDGSTRTTGTDGCAVFSGLNPSTSYTAAVDQSLWVDRSGVRRSVTPAFTVTASGITRSVLSYDTSGTLTMTLATPEGLPAPATLGVTLTSSNFLSLDRQFLECASGVVHGCVSGTPRTATRLFPGQYGAWAGTCQDARPASAVTANVVSGQTTAITLPLAGARVTVVNNGGQPTSGYTVYAVRQEDGTCLAHSWAMSSTQTSTQALALPQGNWTFALNPTAVLPDSGQPWPTKVLTIGEAVPSITVRIP